MRKELTLLSTLGFVWALNLGACAGPELLVGANAGKGGSSGASGTGNDGVTSGTGGTGVTAAGGGTGAIAGTMGGSSPRADSITYYVNQIRFTSQPVVGEPPAVKCLPRPLSVDVSGGVPCQLYPVTSKVANGGACSCDGPGLSGPIEGAVRDSVIDYLHTNGICSEPDDPPCECANPVAPSCDDQCVCAWAQAQGDDRTACQNGETPTDSSGWCYVDGDQGVGDPALVSGCQPTARQRLLFYGDSVTSSEELVIIACALENAPVKVPAIAAPVGAPCLMGDEYRPTFNGYALTEVSIDNETSACESGVCISNHFQGRVSCPYGQRSDHVSEPQCFIPDSNDPVTVPVDAQFLAMPAAERVICSCRCDGPGPGPFCDCPGDMECSPLIRDLGLPGNDSIAGSYCIPKGTAYDPQATVPANTCDPSLMNCGDPRPY